MRRLSKKKQRNFYPSALFNTDEKYFAFFDNLLDQTENLSMNERAAFYIGSQEMMKKKILHDFLMETRRRLLDSK